jgi:hypothetical protein
MKGVASQPIECKSRICSTLVGARGRRPLWSPYVKSRSQN